MTTGARTDTLNAWRRTVAEAGRRLDDVLDAAGRDPATIDRRLMLDPRPAGESMVVTVTMEAGNELGTHTAAVAVRADTPYPVAPIDVTTQVTR